MNIHVRSATTADAEAACLVLRRSITECCAEDHRNDPLLLEAWLSNKTPENVLSWLRAERAIAVVAEVGGSVVGFAMCSLSGEVLLCYVVAELRFTGVGKALLSAIESEARAAGISHLHLESTRTARAFYSRNGFDFSGPPERSFGMEGYPMRKVVANQRVEWDAEPPPKK